MKKPKKAVSQSKQILNAVQHVYESMERQEKIAASILLRQNELEDVLKALLSIYGDIKKFEAMFLKDRGKS